MHDDVDEHPVTCPARGDGSWSRLTWPAHSASSPEHLLHPRGVWTQSGAQCAGCFREGLHEGVRQGLPKGIRPVLDPSPGAITPGHGGGGGSTAWADLGGEWS